MVHARDIDRNPELQHLWIAVPVAALIVASALFAMVHSLNSRQVQRLAPASAAAPSFRAEKPMAVKHPTMPPEARYFESDHFGMQSTADPAISIRILQQVERAHGVVSELLPVREDHRMQLRLARDQRQFQKWFPRRRWAEGLYLRPVAYAYADNQEQRPDQWLVHESVHQILREQTNFHPPRWIEEGFASYIASATVTETEWKLAELDPHTYPTWWFIGTDPTFWSDAQAGYWPRSGMIPISVLIGHIEGPPVTQSFNSYYVSSLLLVHYLMHGNGGQHRAAFLRYLQSPGTPADFERRIGRIDLIQAQWAAALPAQLRPPERALAGDSDTP